MPGIPLFLWTKIICSTWTLYHGPKNLSTQVKIIITNLFWAKFCAVVTSIGTTGPLIFGLALLFSRYVLIAVHAFGVLNIGLVEHAFPSSAMMNNEASIFMELVALQLGGVCK